MKIALTDTARSLRQRLTDAERKLWSRLRDKRLMGFKFRRQAPRGRYVVDFLCVEADLVVEIDGSQHLERTSQRDRLRTDYLESQGLKVLRFWNVDVLTNIDGVLTIISEALASIHPPHPARESAPSSPQGERSPTPPVDRA